MGSRLAVTLVVLAVLVLAAPSVSLADHVVANPSTSARLGERASALSWRVVVDWGIGCSGASTPNYGGNLKLVDQVTDEELYLGGNVRGVWSEHPVGQHESDASISLPSDQVVVFDGAS